jgi:hypothetical protein
MNKSPENQSCDDSELSPFTKVFVSYGIRSDDLDPEEVSMLLGISLTWAFRKDQEYRRRVDRVHMGVRRYPWGVWGLQSDTFVVSDKPQDHIDGILNLLMPKLSNIQLLLSRKGYSSVVRIHLETVEPIFATGFQADRIGDLSKLCHEIGIVVECLAREGRDSTTKAGQ